jgi:hypothetical protein
MRRVITDGVDADAALSSSNEHPLTAKNWRNKQSSNEGCNMANSSMTSLASIVTTPNASFDSAYCPCTISEWVSSANGQWAPKLVTRWAY